MKVGVCIPMAALAAALVAGLPAPGAEPELATTRHQVRANGRTLAYTAHAGLIPILNNEAGEIRGRVFFVAYTLDQPKGQAPRPVTFLWNGGPGANSTLVHLSGFGPRRIRSSDDPARLPAVEPVMEDNDATWLEFTDLVFVDPVGTGFSRPAKAEYAAEFYRTLGDIAYIAEFIRVYLTRFDRLHAPIFLGGESYGTWRASGVAEALEKKGRHVAGVMLISGGIQMGPVSPDAVRVALFVPSRTAAAFYHRKLAPELLRDEAATLKEVERWALEEYAPAWTRRDQLTETERDRVVARLARYTGVDPSTIDRKSLMMTSPQFTSTLLRDQKLTLGRYDMRLKTAPGPPARTGGAARSRVVMRYLRNELGFKSDLPYQGIEEGYWPTPPGRGASIGVRWVWDQLDVPLNTTDARAGALAKTSVGSGDGPPPAQPWLRRAMAINPSIRVFLAAGLYDSLNSCADNRYLAAHVEPPQFGRNITTGCYGGGHMMYDTKAARYQLKRDVAAFVASAIR
ncbi:MAG: peptidase S10 [Bryobacteraceae bacterium]